MLDKFGHEIPSFLQDRPQFNGYVIPFTNMIDEKGVPDFKSIDIARVKECLVGALCGICGKSLMRPEGNSWIAFIGGPISIKNRFFADPGMHKECAYYAAITCPYLRDEHSAHTTSRLEKDGIVTRDHLAVNVTERPAKMGIYMTTGYIVLRAEGRYYAQPFPDPCEIDWKAMPERKS